MGCFAFNFFVYLVFYFVVFATLDGAGSYPQFIAFYSSGDGAVLGIVPRPLAPKLCVPALNIFSGVWSNKTVGKAFVNWSLVPGIPHVPVPTPHPRPSLTKSDS